MKIREMRIGYWLTGTVVTLLARVLVGLRITGLDRIPRHGKLLLVCNHVSNLDPMVVGAIVPREIHFAAKIELFKGIIGKYISYLNAIPVRRTGSDKDTIKKFVSILKDDQALLMFPEGTRAKTPEGKDAKAGAGMIASLAKADVLPTHIAGSHNPKGALFKPGGIRVNFGNPIPYEELVAEAQSTLPEDASKKDLYQAMSDAMMTRVRALAK